LTKYRGSRRPIESKKLARERCGRVAINRGEKLGVLMKVCALEATHILI